MRKSILFIFAAIAFLLSACSMATPVDTPDSNVTINATWISKDGSEAYILNDNQTYDKAILSEDKKSIVYIKGEYVLKEGKITFTPTDICMNEEIYVSFEEIKNNPAFNLLKDLLTGFGNISECTYYATSINLVLTNGEQSTTYSKSSETDITKTIYKNKVSDDTPDNPADNPDEDNDTPDNPADNPDDDNDAPDTPVDNPDDTGNDEDNSGDTDDGKDDPINIPDDPEDPPAEPSIVGNWSLASDNNSNVYFFSDFGTLLWKETTNEGVTFTHGEYKIEDNAIHMSFIAKGPDLYTLAIIKNSAGENEPEEYDGTFQINNNTLTISVGNEQLVVSKSEQQPYLLNNDYATLAGAGNSSLAFTVTKLSFSSGKMKYMNYIETQVDESPAYDYAYNPLISALATTDSRNPYVLCFFEDNVLNLCMYEDFYIPLFPIDRDSNFSLTNKIYLSAGNDILVYTGDYITLYLNYYNLESTYSVDYWETRKELALRYYNVDESYPDAEYLKKGVFNFDYKENDDGTITVTSKILPDQKFEDIVRSGGIVSFVGENKTYTIPFTNLIVINEYGYEYYVEDGKLTAENRLGKKKIYDYSLSFQGEVPTLTLTNETETYTLYYEPMTLVLTKIYDL